VARSHVWWPGLDSEIEEMVRGCEPCQTNRGETASGPKHVWEFPSRKWERLHADFAGPFLGKMYLVVIDSYSKWPEIYEMKSTTSAKTIQVFRKIFAAHGLPSILVTDNGPQWISEEFAEFLNCNGVKHIRGAPYHPETNGLAENMVKTFKRSLKAANSEGVDLDGALQLFLLSYRSTPHSVTGQTPAKLLRGSELRTRLDLLRPELRRTVEKRQHKQIQPSENRRNPGYVVGEHVWARDYRTNHPNWQRAEVSHASGSHYEVQLESGAKTRRHRDQLRASGILHPPQEVVPPRRRSYGLTTPTVEPAIEPEQLATPRVQELEPIAEHLRDDHPIGGQEDAPVHLPPREQPSRIPTPAGVRRSTRERREPIKLNL
jgi:hypothetical protein